MATNKPPRGWLRATLRNIGDRATLSISAIRKFLAEREEGASLTEYVLLIGLIALVCIAGMAALSGHLGPFFTNIASNFTSGG